VLLAVEYSTLTDRTSKAEGEKDWLTYINTTIPVIQDVQRHRLLATAVQNGDESARADLAKSTDAIESEIANLKNVDHRLGGDFGTADLFDKITADWDAVKAASNSASVPSSLAAHAKLINSDLLPLVARVGNASKLFLDPDATSVKDVGGIFQDLLTYEESISNAVAYGADVAYTRQDQPATAVQKDYLDGQVVRANAASDSLDARVASAVEPNSKEKIAIAGALATARTARQFFYSTINTEISGPSAITISGSDFISSGNNATNAAFAAFTAAGAPLGPEFDDRISSARTTELIAAGLAFGGIVVALALSVLVARTITKPLGRLAEVADRMSLGELDIDIDVNGRNEVGQLAESLRRMQASLRSAIERLRVRRAAA
jgi:HAMP domain-containing protein